VTSQKRLFRVASEVKKALAQIISQQLKDTPPGLISIPEVRMTPDLRLARVFISVPGEEQIQRDTLRFLKRHNSKLRHLLAGELRLKFVPELQFRLDESLVNVDRLNELFAKIDADRPEDNDQDEVAPEDDAAV
jgi:ribosome-binding factor A